MAASGVRNMGARQRGRLGAFAAIAAVETARGAHHDARGIVAAAVAAWTVTAVVMQAS